MEFYVLGWLMDFFWSMFSGKQAKILFLGLENAGKTTLFSMLKHGRVTVHPPTQQPTSEEFQVGGITLKAWDMGGHKIARKLWRDYCVKADAIVFIVDSSARENFPEAKAELEGLFADDVLGSIPFLVLGNKIDLPGAVSEQDFCAALGLTYERTGKQKCCNGVRPLEVFMCSVVRKMGYREGFDWLSKHLN